MEVDWKPAVIVQRCCGKFRRKWKTAVNKNKNWTPENYPILRYADVLQMLAEAENEANQHPTDLAYECINKIRERAGILRYRICLTVISSKKYATNVLASFALNHFANTTLYVGASM